MVYATPVLGQVPRRRLCPTDSSPDDTCSLPPPGSWNLEPRARSEALRSTGYSPMLSFNVEDLQGTITRLISLGAHMDGPIRYPTFGKVSGATTTTSSAAGATDEGCKRGLRPTHTHNRFVPPRFWGPTYTLSPIDRSLNEQARSRRRCAGCRIEGPGRPHDQPLRE